MKKLSLFIITMLLIFSGKEIMAQNNLQFNAAKFIQLSCSGSGCFVDSTITVPANTVWKVETAAVNGGSDDYILLNGAIIYNPGEDLEFPIWLPSGSYTLSLQNSPNVSCTGFISAVEFNLVP